MTPESITWNIERVWSATTEGETEQLRTVELPRFRGVIMLGAAGAGKTTEAARLAERERASGATVRECRLAEFADTSTQLAAHLTTLAAEANDRTIFYLDALDEAMVPARGRWLAIKHWVVGELQGTGASIRVTCRSAVWPRELTQVIREFAGNGSFAEAFLQSLSDDDIRTAAVSHGIDPDAFLQRIDASGARSLAESPLSLRMLIRLHQSEDGLPASLKELFEKGLERLASDQDDRREIGTQNPMAPAALLKAGERLACYMMLAGRETLHLGDDPPRNQLSLHDLSNEFTLDELRAIGSSGICDSTSPASFRFGHRQFAEYLAARRLARLPTHQVRAFLASPGGWRSGVAGPLRETAAFTAMFNPDVADWIAAHDPDVVGLSDVAEGSLRRTATLALLERFRRGELTDAQLRPGVLELRGLRYDDAAADLRPLFVDRVKGPDDQLKCAAKMAATWKLSSLGDDLADLVLDTTVSLAVRVIAAYALQECGDATARRRLKPLIGGVSEDVDDELKGIALSCNWPDHLSTRDLLKALTPRRRSTLYGAYEDFLVSLDREGFAAEEHVVAGLQWARTRDAEAGEADPLNRIAMRIAQKALEELDDPVVARELTAFLRRSAEHHTSPLVWLPEKGWGPGSTDEQKAKAPLRTHVEARRRLIDALAGGIETWKELRELAYLTPGLPAEGDFRWLLGRARDERQGMAVRKHYVHLAGELCWWDTPENLGAWLRVCDDEPVKSILGNKKSVAMDSEEATESRKDWNRIYDIRSTSRVPALDPPPRDRVVRALGLAEKENVRYFRNLCRELTLKPSDTHYHSAERFLTKTPGWQEADTTTRDRIVGVAKRYVSIEGLPAEASREVSPRSFSVDILGAIWLILERDPDWLESRSESWWKGRCWYLLRELSPNLAGEPREPKQEVLRLVNDNAPSTLCQEMLALALGQDSDFDDLLASLLPLLLDISNVELDEKLCASMRAGAIPEGNVQVVCGFVVTRAPETAIPVCLDILSGAVEGMAETVVEHVAVSLLRQRAGQSWPALRVFLDSEEERGRRVLKSLAYGGESRLLDSMSTKQLGELTRMLIELFSPETDADSEGVHTVTADDEVRTLRSRLVAYLAGLEDAEAVETLRELEHRLGAQHPWLRRPRSEVERAFRLSRWLSFPVDVVAGVIGAGERRLIRSEDDVVDGIEYGLGRYATALRRDDGESPEDLWNAARGDVPTPKSEEHISSKLCGVVRSYFREFAVTADREVEIRRRSIPRGWGGESGSEVDVLFQAPGAGTVSGDTIRVPIEVKLSCNGEAKAGMRAQLADRYMLELGASHGVYVVVWMSVPQPDRLREAHRPKWASMESAREDLRVEAERLLKEKGIRVRPIVVDGSLR